MTVALFVGSPRVGSNTRSMAAYLKARLKERGEDVVVLDVKAPRLDEDTLVLQSIEALREADSVVLMTPVYLDLPPHVALAWLRAVWEKREKLEGAAPVVYGVSHSGYFEPVHKRISLEAMEHFARRMEWPWLGALAFGGTSPIEGKPLEQAGPFSKKVRPALDRLAELIPGKQPVPADLVRDAGKRPIPLPNRLVVWVMNAARRRK